MERRRNGDLLIPFASFFEENTAVCPAHCAPLVASSLAVWFGTAVREDDDMPWCIYHARRLKRSWLRRRTCRWGSKWSKIQFSKAKMTEATATDTGLIWQNYYCRLLPCQCLCHHMLYDYSASLQSLEAFLQRHQDSSSASVQVWLHMLGYVWWLLRYCPPWQPGCNLAPGGRLWNEPFRGSPRGGEGEKP